MNEQEPDRGQSRPGQPDPDRPVPEQAGRESAATNAGHQQAGPPRQASAEPGPSSAQGGPGSAQAELSELRSRVSEAEDSRLRALADLDNFRKRCAVQVGRAAAEAKAAVAAEWLPVVDDLDRALEHSQADPDVIIEGVRSVRDQALGILASLGFPRREDTGAMFDPARHDAVAVHSEAGAAEGTVIDVVRPGYGDGDHQLRPAQVVVAKAE
jgi:molecular chaperone GrpE